MDKLIEKCFPNKNKNNEFRRITTELENDIIQFNDQIKTEKIKLKDSSIFDIKNYLQK